jgi:LysM repeat protein/ABC-type branched-subunit amino acid transport system substrate-binding protein
MMIQKSVVFAVLLLTAVVVSAQINTADLPPKTTINGKSYYLHKVQKSEGLFRIAKNYQVTEAQILAENPEAASGLKEGQVLRIPVNTGASPTAQPSNAYVYHTVEAGQTLYSIAQKYKIPFSVIYDHNPSTKEGLRVGEVLAIPKSEIKGEIPGQKYQYHTVKPQETVYGISRIYGISVDELLKSNPAIDGTSIKVGDHLRIPQQSEAVAQVTMRKHTVERKETLFAISKKYNVEMSDIQKANPDVNFSKLKKGVQLNIPAAGISEVKQIVDERVAVSPDTTFPGNDCNAFNYFREKPTLKIAVLLPFNAGNLSFSDTTTISADELGSQDASISSRTRIVLEFYEGFLFGLEQFKNRGINIQLQTYDTHSDPARLSQILRRPELANVDLIIGPAHAQHLAAVSAFSNQHRIKMVYPFSVNNSELHRNPNLFHMMPSDSLLFPGMCSVIGKTSVGKQVVMISPATGNGLYERNFRELVKNQVHLANQHKGTLAAINEINFTAGALHRIEAALSQDRENLIVIPSVDEIFVNQVLIALDAIKDKGRYKMQLVGLPAWLRYQTIEPETVHKLNGMFFSYYAYDEQLAETRNFITGYRNLFHTEPIAINPYFQKASVSGGYSRFGIWGYDIASYFVEAMVQYGPQFESCLDHMKRPLIQSNFKFRRLNTYGGFYNEGLILINFKNDFTITRTLLNNE